MAPHTSEHNQPGPFTSSGSKPITNQGLAEILTLSQKGPLPEWKLSSFDGNPLQWPKWFGQFKNAIDAKVLIDDVKLTYLAILVSGKAKNAIAEFAYSGIFYKDALKTLERKFGQPQTIVAAHLGKLLNFPPLKMHNSESIISFASSISSLVAVLKTLRYKYDLKSTSVLNQVFSKLPSNMKESWSLHSIKKCWRQPTILDFNDWLCEKAEAHELLRVSQNKSLPGETPKTGFHKPPTKVFAAASKFDKPIYAPCLQCKGTHPPWSCSVFKEKTPTQRAQFSAQNRLCFACLLAFKYERVVVSLLYKEMLETANHFRV